MKANSTFGKKVLMGVALLVLAGLATLAAAPADSPLTKDDVTLLLLGGSPSSKIIEIVRQRGVTFQMNPDLAKTFHDQGASDDVIETLRKAGEKSATVAPTAPAAPPNSPPVTSSSNPPPAAESSPAGKPNAPDVPQPGDETPAAPASSARTSTPPSSDEPVLHTRHSADSASAPPAESTPPAPSSPTMRSSSEPVMHEAAKKEPDTPPIASSAALKELDAQGIQHVIQEFAAKEKVFREARNNYTYHQINKVEELGGGNEIMGTFEQEWDILYDDSGKRIEKVTYAPVNTLKNLIVTKEDMEGFRNIQPFVLTTDELPEYEIKYLGHVKVDQITAYVFSIRPKEMQKNRQYFKGIVWVDDRDYQIVKSEGKQVPEAKVSHGQENLFPRFTTWREQVDGKFWFPTFTMADDTLYFSNGPPVHMKEVVRYTDYKQFKSGVRILTVESMDKDKTKDQSTPAPASPQK
jgi:hypothetical protein